MHAFQPARVIFCWVRINARSLLRWSWSCMSVWVLSCSKWGQWKRCFFAIMAFCFQYEYLRAIVCCSGDQCCRWVCFLALIRSPMKRISVTCLSIAFNCAVWVDVKAMVSLFTISSKAFNLSSILWCQIVPSCNQYKPLQIIDFLMWDFSGSYGCYQSRRMKKKIPYQCQTQSLNNQIQLVVLSAKLICLKILFHM